MPLPEVAQPALEASQTSQVETSSQESSLTEPVDQLEARLTQAQTPTLSFPITGTPGHSASGNIRIVNDNSGTLIVRFENYKGTNGPDLYVYLASDKNATDFINLGEAKGNQGNINYTVPAGTSLEDYPYVLT